MLRPKPHARRRHHRLRARVPVLSDPEPRQPCQDPNPPPQIEGYRVLAANWANAHGIVPGRFRGTLCRLPAAPTSLRRLLPCDAQCHKRLSPACRPSGTDNGKLARKAVELDDVTCVLALLDALENDPVADASRARGKLSSPWDYDPGCCPMLVEVEFVGQ